MPGGRQAPVSCGKLKGRFAMAVDPAIIKENEEATARLAALVTRMSDADLSRDLGEG